MRPSPLATIFGILSVVAAIVGVIFFFINPTVTIVCAVISILNSIIQVVCGDQNNLTTEIATIVIAIIIALIADISIFNTICFALCIVEALMTVIGWIFMLVAGRRF